MSRRLALSIAAVLACAIPLSATQAATPTKTTKTFSNVTAKLHVVDAVKGDAVFAGTVNGPFGSGAVRLVSHVSGSNANGPATVFYDLGTLKLKTKNTFGPQPDGKIKYDGTGTIAGGTGRYAGATGTLKFSGTAGADAVITLKVNGKITYRR